MTQTLDEIKKTVIRFAKNKDVEINGDTKLIEDLGYDSIGFVALIMNFEEQYGFVFDDDMMDFKKLTTYGLLQDYITGSKK